MNNHKVVLKAKKVNKGDKVHRWIERMAHVYFEVPEDGIILMSDHPRVPSLYIRNEDIENILKSSGEEIEIESWGDDASILPYS